MYTGTIDPGKVNSAGHAAIGAQKLPTAEE
jgi:hypothetical protein